MNDQLSFTGEFTPVIRDKFESWIRMKFTHFGANFEDEIINYILVLVGETKRPMSQIFADLQELQDILELSDESLKEFVLELGELIISFQKPSISQPVATSEPTISSVPEPQLQTLAPSPPETNPQTPEPQEKKTTPPPTKLTSVIAPRTLIAIDSALSTSRTTRRSQPAIQSVVASTTSRTGSKVISQPLPSQQPKKEFPTPSISGPSTSAPAPPPPSNPTIPVVSVSTGYQTRRSREQRQQQPPPPPLPSSNVVSSTSSSMSPPPPPPTPPPLESLLQAALTQSPASLQAIQAQMLAQMQSQMLQLLQGNLVKPEGGKRKFDTSVSNTNTNALDPTSRNFKTRPCAHYAQGRCRKGDACTFLHDPTLIYLPTSRSSLPPTTATSSSTSGGSEMDGKDGTEKNVEVEGIENGQNKKGKVLPLAPATLMNEDDDDVVIRTSSPSTAPVPPVSSSTAPRVKPTAPCIFFSKKGFCNNGDNCPYRHDPSKAAHFAPTATVPPSSSGASLSSSLIDHDQSMDIAPLNASTKQPDPCFYFQSGSCNKGASCPFTHQINPAFFAAQAQAQQSQKFQHSRPSASSRPQGFYQQQPPQPSQFSQPSAWGGRGRGGGGGGRGAGRSMTWTNPGSGSSVPTESGLNAHAKEFSPNNLSLPPSSSSTSTFPSFGPSSQQQSTQQSPFQQQSTQQQTFQQQQPTAFQQQNPFQQQQQQQTPPQNPFQQQHNPFQQK